MRKILLAAVLIVAFICNSHGQSKLFPAIKHFGGISKVLNAVDNPDHSLTYKIIVEIGSRISHPDSIYDPFEMVSRMYSLHIYGGIKPENLKIDLVIYAAAIPVVLNNEAYRKKYGVDNPNTEVIEAMKKAGINIYACGQSVNVTNIDPKEINSNIEVALSRLTTVSTRQLKVYALFKF